MAHALTISNVYGASILKVFSEVCQRGISSYVGLQNKGLVLSRTVTPRPLTNWGKPGFRHDRRASRQLYASAAAEVQTYEVQKGDSLWGIAMDHDLTVEKLKSLNPSLDSSSGIDVGQLLVVGVKKVEPVEVKQGKADPMAEVSRSAPAAGPGTQERRPVPVAAKAERRPVPVAGVAKSPPASLPAQGVALSPSVVGLGIAIAGAIAFSSSLGVKNSKATSVLERSPATPTSFSTHASTNGSAVTAAPKRVKRAAPAALAAIAESFPNAMEQESFIRACATELRNLGFRRDNCIALVNTCRDEVCRPLVDLIDREFGLSFNLAGLGGLVNSGITGLKAGMSHSPEFPCDESGIARERYIFFAFPHISIGETGEAGSLLRRGRGRPSSACGALIAVKNEVKTYVDESNKPYPADDFEYHSLKRKILAQPACRRCGPAGPSLVTVTKAAQEVITEDLEDLIAKAVDPNIADYAVITGVQIHSGCQVPGEPFRLDRTVDYIAPSAMYAIIRGERYMMHCEVNQINLIRSIKPELTRV